MNTKRVINNTFLFFGIIISIFFFAGLCLLEIGEYVAGGIVTGIFGLAIVGIVIWIIMSKKNTAKLDNLKVTGKHLQGRIHNFLQDFTVKVNGAYPFIVRCTYTDEYGQEQVFYSERLWEDPEMNLSIGDVINIYVDRNNERLYYVDVEDAIVQAGKRRLME